MSINMKIFASEEDEAEDPVVEAPKGGMSPKEAARWFVDNATPDQRIAMAGLFLRQQAEAAPETFAEGAPQTPDELWDYINDVWNVKVARVSVCEGHDTPFDFICAGYFEWFPNIFGIGPRGGGKSYLMALLHELNSRMKPGCTSSTFGAVDEQSKKVYQDMVNIFVNGGLPDGESEIAGESTQLKTMFKNGSEVNCFPGTLAKVNGPHPPKVHSDEVEIMKAIVWAESRNMAANKIMPDGRVIKAQNIGTSTRKWKNGRVDKIYQEFIKAKKAAIERFGLGDKRRVDALVVSSSKFYVFIWCIFEVAEQMPNCRCVEENKDLPEYDWEDEDMTRKCGCHEVVNGTWDKDGKVPRTLASVCGGRFHRSRGHRQHWEVKQLFTQNDRGTWEAQQECSEAESEGLYVKSFSKERHGLQFFPLDPANGPIYTGTDWGTTHYACVLWVQYLERAVTAVSYEGEVKVLPKGARVVFKEIYEADMTSEELGQKAILAEVRMAQPTSFNRVPVRRRWADVQGKGDRKVWRKMALKTEKYSTRVFSEHVKTVRGLFDADRAFVVVGDAPHYCDEMESWRQDEKQNEVDENFNHAMAAGRYVFYGMHDVYNDDGSQDPETREAVEQANGDGGSSVPVVVVTEVVGTDSDYDLESESEWMGQV